MRGKEFLTRSRRNREIGARKSKSPVAWRQPNFTNEEILLLAVAALPVLVSSCATPKPAQVCHNADASGLIVKSFDNRTCEVIAPTAIVREANARVRGQATVFPRHQTAVVILENDSKPQVSPEFRDRTFGWFIGLRGCAAVRCDSKTGRSLTDAVIPVILKIGDEFCRLIG
jgi:hypothetical protein